MEDRAEEEDRRAFFAGGLFRGEEEVAHWVLGLLDFSSDVLDPNLS